MDSDMHHCGFGRLDVVSIGFDHVIALPTHSELGGRIAYLVVEVLVGGIVADGQRRHQMLVLDISKADLLVGKCYHQFIGAGRSNTPHPPNLSSVSLSKGWRHFRREWLSAWRD